MSDEPKPPENNEHRLPELPPPDPGWQRPERSTIVPPAKPWYVKALLGVAITGGVFVVGSVLFVGFVFATCAMR